MDLIDYSDIGTSDDDFEIVQSHEARLPQKELDKIAGWLQPTDYNAESSEFRRHLLSRAPGTGAWLCETDRYRQWLNSPQHGSLWIKGVPGAGKSVLAASVVEQLQESQGADVPVLFFFFRHIILANRHSKSLVRDWLSQLLPHSIALQGALHPLLGTALLEVPDNVLWECLLKGLAAMPKVFCIVDALDEMETKDSTLFFQRLNSLATFRPDNVKLFMTSRPRQDLQSCLSATSIIHISLEEDKVGREIEVFIKHRLSQTTSRSLAARESLAKEIAARSRGLFLYARLLIDQILPELEKNAQLDINALPIHLEDMYNQMLSRQAEEVKVDREIQVALLGLITHCVRPMRLREVAGFLEQKLHNGSLEVSKNIARFACHPLIQVLEDETVQVIHHSFTEFLLDTSRRDGQKGIAPQFPVLEPFKIHRDLAVDCLDTLGSALGLVRGESEDPIIGMPFLEYVKLSVGHHISSSKDRADEELFEAIGAVCRAMNDQYPSEDRRYHVDAHYLRISGAQSINTPLKFAALTGLTEYARKIVSNQDPETELWSFTDDSGREYMPGTTPIELACNNGHLTIMKMIWTPEHQRVATASFVYEMVLNAVSRGNSAILDFLLKPESRVVPEESQSRLQLLSKLRDSSPNCLRLLFSYLTEEELNDLFTQYASCGRSDMLDVIYQAGVKSEWKTQKGSALYQVCAAENKVPGHIDCARLLLPSFPDINGVETVIRTCSFDEATRQPEKDRTVLHALAANWYDGNHEISSEIFELLKSAGANLEARDGMGDTPILCLFPRSFNKSVRKPLSFLLEAGADLNARDNEGAGLIHRSVKNHVDIHLIKTLLAHNADINAVWPRFDHRPSTPALAMMWDDTDWGKMLWGNEKGHEKVMHNTRGELAAFMVENGATIDAGGDPAAVLVEALCSCDLQTFQLLLSSWGGTIPIDRVMFSMHSDLRGTYVSKHDKTESDGALAFINALLDVGVSIEVRDEKGAEGGATPLLTSVDNLDLFDKFLKAGADRNAVDFSGRGVLHKLLDVGYFARHDLTPLDRLREFVKMGFDPFQLDHEGASLLHVIVTKARHWVGETPSAIHQLIEYGLSPRAKTKTGLTPLHYFFDVRMNQIYDRSPANKNLLTTLDALEGAKEGIDINAQDDEGITPLHLAAISNLGHSIDFIKILMDHGADPTIRADGAKSVLHLAARARNSAAVGYIVDRVPELIHYTDKDGRTPLFDACASGVLESVACLVRAGSDLSLTDAQGWTALHACADFTEEHCRWTTNEEEIRNKRKIQFDRYRPYIPSLLMDSAKFSEYVSLDSPRQKCDGASYILENPDLSIFAVTRALIAAGADVKATGKERVITPAMRAYEKNCKGMMLALASTGTVMKSRFEALDDMARTDILRNPWDAVSTLSPADIAWLKDNDADLFRTLRQETKENNLFEKPFRRGHSFIEAVALTGLTEAMGQLGSVVCRDENPGTAPIDKWTQELIAGNCKCNIPSNKEYGSTWNDMVWKPDELKTVLDYLHPTAWEVEPLLRVACRRTAPNLEMLRVLVETSGVDINAPTVKYPGKRLTEKESNCNLLQLLASKQQFWHLDAIRYLVSKGAEINAQDEHGKTALHHACSNDGFFAPRFVHLLLELGADPNIEDIHGLTSVAVAESSEVLHALSNHGVNLSEQMNNHLWLGIGKLNVEMVRLALDTGVDVNRLEESPIYTHEELDWEIHTTPLSEGCAAIPLAGALLYNDYLQEECSPTGEDLRASIIRLLLDRGADPFGPFQITSHDNDGDDGEPRYMPLIHQVFEEICCQRKYLEVLLERSDKIDFNLRRDTDGRTVFLAACNAALSWSDPDAFTGEKYPKSDDDVDHKSEEIWDSTGLFLKMLDHGAQVTAVDNNGDNALHILLANPSVFECHILEFLERPESYSLLSAKNSKGFTPLQLALRILRPATVEKLISLGLSLREYSMDPEGYSPLHRIAAHCLTRRIALAPGHSSCRLLPRPADFLPACKRLWKQCLAAGMDINAPDGTEGQNPPLFHYLAHHADTVQHPSRFFNSDEFKHDNQCHMENFDDFFSTANLKIMNKRGDGALHIVAVNGISLDGTEMSYSQRRPSLHDADLFRFLVGEKGLDPLLEDATGRTSLDLAAEGRRQAILDVFKQKN